MVQWKGITIGMLGLVISVSACGKKPVPPAPAPAQTAAAPVDDRAAAERAAREAAERAAAERQRELQRAREVLAQMVFFDYDMAELRDDARRALDAKLPVLRNDAGIRLRIEGHADERGSTEYNLALGSRRAMTVANYLSGYGVDMSRLETVSYGEERPLARGSSEASWAQNRRAEFVITGGGLMTTDASAGGR